MTVNVKDMVETAIRLDADSELRFEVENKKETVTVTLKSGMAELFGSELVKNGPYTFTFGTSSAIYTWHGCTLLLYGRKNVSYVSKVTPMYQYLNIHAILDEKRTIAEKEEKRGPVTMIVGPIDAGKTTLSRILLNYASRLGRTPVFVDLDVALGSISVPGTIGAAVVERPEANQGFFDFQSHLIYHFGHIAPNKNPKLMKLLITNMANTLYSRMDTNKKVNASGVIIKTCSWTKGEGYTQLIHTAQAFKVDSILILGEEKLYNQLLHDKAQSVKVVLLPKSGGVVNKSPELRLDLQENKIKEYFYGETALHRLHPYRIDLKFSNMTIYKIGAPELPASCMPHGMKLGDHMTKIVRVYPCPNLLHHLLALSYAENFNEVTNTNIAGYICVININVKNQMMTVLSPEPALLPECFFILSDVQFVDTV